MKQEIYCIKDTKAGAFRQPWQAENKAIALRTITTLANEPGTEPGLYPEDFELWKVAELDTVTGAVTPMLEFTATFMEVKKN